MYRIKYEGCRSVNICLSQSETKKWDMSVHGEIGWEVKRDIIIVWVEWNASPEDRDVAAIDAVKNSGKWVIVDISFKDATEGVHEWEWLHIYSFIVEEGAYVRCRLECYTQEHVLEDYMLVRHYR